MKDYYQILGIQNNASDDEIKQAYRRLAHKHHPDKGGDEQKFKEINEAYQILGNKEKREQYDRFGTGFEAGEGFSGFGRGFDPGAFWGNMKSGDSDFGLNLDDLFEDFFGFSAKTKKKNIMRGKDIELLLEMNLEETLNNLKKSVFLRKNIKCSRCGGLGAEPGSKIKECFSCRGRGEVQQIKKTIFGTISRSVVCPECAGIGKVPEKKCNVCNGEGRIKGEEELEINIPKGMDSGQTIKIEGRGEAGKRGSEAGDLYLKIFIKKHSFFERKGDDLYASVLISFSQAALGGEIEVPTLEGKNILLKVPAGVKSGKIFRIPAKGIPGFNSWTRGDFYVELEIKTPDKLTKKQRELLEKLKEEGL